ncbi:MAG: N-acetylmuramoyl-L-alanine amidase [Actinomycetota bacterium]
MRRTYLRLIVVVGLMAALLVPSIAAPAKTITVPTTLARTVAPDGSGMSSTNFDFPPTHIAFSWRGDDGTGVRYRTISSGGEASRWRRAPEAHDAERGNRHFSGVLAVDRPIAVRWRKIVPRGASMNAPVLDYLNTLDGTRELRTIPATAEAAARTPDIVTRAEWGADESVKRTSGGCVRKFFPVQQLFVHHTAGSNFDKHPKATMRAIYWYHVVRQGWCDVGYNFVISPDGTVFEGRWARSYAPWETHDSEDRKGRAVVGAHVSNFNSGSVGISVMGNYSQVKPPPAVRRSLAELLAWEADRHDLRPRGRHIYRNPETGLRRRLPYIAGHRDGGQTECPGNFLYRALPAIRRDTSAVMGAGKLDTVLTLEPSTRRITYGEQVTFSGALTGPDGLGIPDQPLRSFVKTGAGAWTRGPQTVTAPDGSFSFVLQPEESTRLVAIYDGDVMRWGTESFPRRVRVAPLVTLAAEGGLAEPTGVTHYGPGTTTITFSGVVDPPHVGHDVFIRVEKLQSDGTFALLEVGSAELDGASEYEFEWVVVDPGVGGSYRAFARLPKHDDHARGLSPVVSFVIDPQP